MILDDGLGTAIRNTRNPPGRRLGYEAATARRPLRGRPGRALPRVSYLGAVPTAAQRAAAARAARLKRLQTQNAALRKRAAVAQRAKLTNARRQIARLRAGGGASAVNLDPAASEAYWTPERYAQAQPFDLPTVDFDGGGMVTTMPYMPPIAAIVAQARQDLAFGHDPQRAIGWIEKLKAAAPELYEVAIAETLMQAGEVAEEDGLGGLGANANDAKVASSPQLTLDVLDRLLKLGGGIKELVSDDDDDAPAGPRTPYPVTQRPPGYRPKNGAILGQMPLLLAAGGLALVWFMNR